MQNLKLANISYNYQVMLPAGMTAQFLEHYTGIAEVLCESHSSLDFFRLYFLNCLSWVTNCDDIDLPFVKLITTSMKKTTCSPTTLWFLVNISIKESWNTKWSKSLCNSYACREQNLTLIKCVPTNVAKNNSIVNDYQ